jgi:hypothetical protein
MLIVLLPIVIAIIVWVKAIRSLKGSYRKIWTNEKFINGLLIHCKKRKLEKLTKSARAKKMAG